MSMSSSPGTRPSSATAAPPGYTSIPEGLDTAAFSHHPTDPTVCSIVNVPMDLTSPRPVSIALTNDFLYDELSPGTRASTIAQASRRSAYYRDPQILSPPTDRRSIPLILSPADSSSPLSTPSISQSQTQSMFHRRDSTTSSSTTILSGNTKVNPTNFVSLSRSSTSKRRLSSFHKNSSSIKGPFAINPYMHVPTGLLASLPESDEENPAGRLRTNLRLDCQNGGIDVDLYLTGDPAKASTSHLGRNKERALLNLELKDGMEPGLDRFPLIARLHTPDLARPPFQLCATAINGYVSIHLPSSFQGLLTIHIGAGDLERHIEISTNLLEHSVLLRETNDSRSYFVGEMGGWVKGENNWDGDEIIATVENGLVRVQFEDENASDLLRKVIWRYVGL